MTVLFAAPVPHCAVTEQECSSGVFLSVPGTKNCSHEVDMELNRFHAPLHLPVHTELVGLNKHSSALSPPWNSLSA